MAPADAQYFFRGVPRDHVQDEGMHAQNPRVFLARVDIAASYDDQVEFCRVRKGLALDPLLIVVEDGGWVEKG